MYSKLIQLNSDLSALICGVHSGLELMPAGIVYKAEVGQNVHISCIAKGDYPTVKQARERVVANLQWKYRDKLIPRVRLLFLQFLNHVEIREL